MEPDDEPNKASRVPPVIINSETGETLPDATQLFILLREESGVTHRRVLICIFTCSS